MKNRTWTYVLLILAVAIGSLATLCVQLCSQRRMLLKTEYQDWRKLNLILNQIELNYVDTIDRAKLTDAAVQAVLSQLDPHSIYLHKPRLPRYSAECLFLSNDLYLYRCRI